MTIILCRYDLDFSSLVALYSISKTHFLKSDRIDDMHGHYAREPLLISLRNCRTLGTIFHSGNEKYNVDHAIIQM